MAASFNTVKKAKIIVLCIFVGLSSYCSSYIFITITSGRICVSNQNASQNAFRELYYWLTEVLIFMFPFISLVTMNSLIIHTLRKRSKLQFSESAGQSHSKSQSQGHNLKLKQSEKRVFTLVLLITFVFSTLNIPTRILVFDMNFYSGHTAHYFAGLHLFFQVGEATYIANHGINFFLYVISGSKRMLRNLFSSTHSNKAKSLVTNINTVSSGLPLDDI